MTSRRNRILLGFLIALLGLASQAQAATLPYATVFARVDGGLTLQNAIDVAPDGAIIILEPGIYRENLRIEKPITLIGTEGVFLEPADETYPAVSIFDTDRGHHPGRRHPNGPNRNRPLNRVVFHHGLPAQRLRQGDQCVTPQRRQP